MTKYLLKRAIHIFLVLFFVSYASFALMALMPGDPVDLMVQSSPNASADDVIRLRKLYGLDQPGYVRYGNWLKMVAKGDLGYSRTYRIPVTELVAPKLLNTIYLSGASLFLALLVAVPLGVYAALRAGTRVDRWVTLLASSSISIPPFWLAIMLILLFAVYVPLLPAGGTSSIGLHTIGILGELLDRGRYLLLPTLALSFRQMGRLLRFTRTAMIEVLNDDFIRTARAKGVARPTIIWKHAFRNALCPLITVIALSLSSLVSGALITETVFAYQGIGKLVYDSVMSNDFNVAMVCFIISAALVMIFNLFADLLYTLADPRVGYT